MKALYIFFLIFHLSILLNAQKIAWLAPGAKWEYTYSSNGGPGRSYQEIRDTITKGGHLCRIIEMAHMSYVGNTDIQKGPDQYCYVQNDTVFQWYEGAFKILYNFTLKQGDTLGPLPHSWHVPYAIVEKTGDTLYEGIPVRYQDLRIPFNQFFNRVRVYEGIGGLSFFDYDVSGTPFQKYIIPRPATGMMFLPALIVHLKKTTPDSQSQKLPGVK